MGVVDAPKKLTQSDGVHLHTRSHQNLSHKNGP